MQVLRNIVPAIARTDDKNILTFPSVTVGVLAGVQDLAGEIAQGGDVRGSRHAPDACGRDDVSRVYFAFGTVSAPKHNRPPLRFLVVGAALKFGSRPEIELHAFRIGFKPTGNFV